MTRPEKVKLDIVKIPSNLAFSENIAYGSRVSVYVKAISDALAQSCAVRILAKDSYMKHQLKGAAKKLKLKLTYAVQDEYLLIKPIQMGEDTKRLMLYLREPRTLNELRSKKLELHLDNTLEDLRGKGLAHIFKDKWVLTEQGLDSL